MLKLALGHSSGCGICNFWVWTAKGDVLALYMDGLLEASNAAGEEFGIKRLQAELQRLGNESLNVICQSLQESVARHGTQFDDQSVLLIRQL
jgi:serine phosphatase RsbU (regulator of sigma subunit)